MPRKEKIMTDDMTNKELKVLLEDFVEAILRKIEKKSKLTTEQIEEVEEIIKEHLKNKNL